MSNPFERHGIMHLSPSSLNCYAEAPAFWALKYLHGFEDEVGPSAWRGNAVEAGLDHWLFKRDLGAAQEAALVRFEQEALGLADDATDKERNVIAPMLKIATELLTDRPMPEARQVKVEHWFDGIEVPVIGFADYVWPDDGVDLKTTHRMPNEIPGNHGRQGALYSVVKQRPWKLLYVTGKKGEIKELGDPSDYLRRLESYAHSVRKLLSMFTNKTDAARVFAPDFDHFYWKREEARAAASQIWT